MLTISHNEIVVACRKAIEGLGLSQGQAEDGANSIGWLLSHGLSLPADFLFRLDSIEPATILPIQQQSNRENGSTWDAQSLSGLHCFPNLADFASVQATISETQIHNLTVQNLADIDLIWPYLVNLQKRGFYIRLRWAGLNQDEHIVVFSDQAEPDCYLLESKVAKQDQSVSLLVSVMPFGEEAALNWPLIRIDRSVDLQSNYLDRTENGIKIVSEVWDRLNVIGKRLLVESTAESEQRGAGGV